jgi:hypothetical protein
MFNCIQNSTKAYAIKYTGETPLKIHSAKKVGLNENHKYTEETLYSAPVNHYKGRGSR